MTHSGDPAAIIIYPITNVAQELTTEQHSELLDWFKVNGIDPTGVPIGEQLEIGSDIDFWWLAYKRGPDPSWPIIGPVTVVSGDPTRTHHRIRTTVSLPGHLADALRALQAQVEANQAAVQSQLAAAGILPGERPE